MAQLLCDNGYDVLFAENANRAAFLAAFDTFRRKYAPGATEAFVFYAGHGMNVEGRDVLAPIDTTYDCDEKKNEPAVFGEVPLEDLGARVEGYRQRHHRAGCLPGAAV